MEWLGTCPVVRYAHPLLALRNGRLVQRELRGRRHVYGSGGHINIIVRYGTVRCGAVGVKTH